MAKVPKNTPAAVGAITLAALVAATQSPAGMLFAEPSAVQSLVDNGLAEVNTAMVNPNHGGEFAVRATPKGIEMNTTAPNNDTPASTVAAKPTFLRQMIDAPPRSNRGGPGSGGLYPFDELVAPITDPATGKVQNDAFFVPATADKPKPWESLSSAVSAATRKYATETGKRPFDKKDGTKGERATYAYTRKFRAVEGKATDSAGKEHVGAWVVRDQ